MASNGTKENVLSLIKKYSEYPCLWNCKLQEYKNRLTREDAYKKIASELPQFTIEMVKAKIQTLRGQYRKQLSLIKKSAKSGAGSDEIFKPTLWCFDQLNFLIDDVICETVSSLSLVSAFNVYFTLFSLKLTTILFHHIVNPLPLLYYFDCSFPFQPIIIFC